MLWSSEFPANICVTLTLPFCKKSNFHPSKEKTASLNSIDFADQISLSLCILFSLSATTFSIALISLRIFSTARIGTSLLILLGSVSRRFSSCARSAAFSSRKPIRVSSLMASSRDVGLSFNWRMRVEVLEAEARRMLSESISFFASCNDCWVWAMSIWQ